MLFWLGVHRPGWLGKTAVPLFVSRETLKGRRTLPRALGPWALDSGAFSLLRRDGGFTTTPREYAADIRRYAEEIGGLQWAAPQDWMCEPFMLARTGLTVTEHQRRTVENFLNLRALDAPVIPVVQGWALDDYLRHADDYARAGVELARLPLVGVGSVCRRHDVKTGERVVRHLAGLGLRLHGFGVKLTGLRRFGDALTSADSMAWSYRARRAGRPMRADCAHARCANCLRYALDWRDTVLQAVTRPQQRAWAL